MLCELTQSGTLRVSGDDGQSFLQNLLSNDIRELDAPRAQYSSLNTPKGRALATMLVFRADDAWLLHLPRALCEPLRKKLSMYVLRAKVQIADVSDTVAALGLAGTEAQEIVRERFGELPSLPLGIVRAGTSSAIRLGNDRFMIIIAAQDAPALRQALEPRTRQAGSEYWDWLDIRAGIPSVLPATQEAFVPQMINFDLIGGINFKKGCYPGQEIVARMQYLGKPKRRMYLAHLDTATAPQAGDELFSADMEGGQPSGMIVNAAPVPDGGFDALAVVHTASHDAFPVHLGALTGARLQFQPLPYPLP